MKKKKGFTLVELIAAIAILSIAMVGISSAVYTGTKLSAKNAKKADSSELASNIMQYYKSQGKTALKELFNFTSTGSSKYNGFCYFNTDDELSNYIKTPLDTSIWTIGDAGTKTKINSSQPKKYAAYIELTVNNSLDNGTSNPVTFGDIEHVNDFVRIYVYVTNLKGENISSSDLVFYLGR